MNILVHDLNNLLYAARAEGYEDGLRNGQINAQYTNAAKTSGCQGDTNLKSEPTAADYAAAPETAPETDNEEYFEIYGEGFKDGYDDGYGDAIATIRERLPY
jgi:hypothetical protein